MELPPQRASVPVVTDATAASPDILDEAVLLFLGVQNGPFRFERCGGGVNNANYYVTTASNDRYVMRVYNNGQNEPRVRYEHEVLRQLNERSRGLIPVQVPRPVAVSDGQTFVTLSSGGQACLFPVIPGTAPEITAAHSIGKATARLVACLSDVLLEPDYPLPNPLYRNIYESHHKITKPLFETTVAGQLFDVVRPDMDFLMSEIARCDLLIGSIMSAGGLPEQQIHADLHFDNVLCLGDEVSGILDFEFSAYDWRVMELVVGLSKYAGMKEPTAPIAAYIQGYHDGGGRLSDAEVDLVPDLIILRILCNVVYFVGRGVAGEDTFEPLLGRANVYASRCKWLAAQRGWLITALGALRGSAEPPVELTDLKAPAEAAE
jgi:homoserine kinase type II